MSTNLMYTEPEAAPRPRTFAGSNSAHTFGPVGRLLPGTSVACGMQDTRVARRYPGHRRVHRVQERLPGRSGLESTGLAPSQTGTSRPRNPKPGIRGHLVSPDCSTGPQGH